MNGTKNHQKLKSILTIKNQHNCMHLHLLVQRKQVYTGTGISQMRTISLNQFVIKNNQH